MKLNRAILLLMILMVRWLVSADTLPPDHWAYSDIFYLVNRGVLVDLDITRRPFIRLEVAKSLLSQLAPNSSRQEQEIWALKRLADELEFELEALQTDYVKPAGLRASLATLSRVTAGPANVIENNIKFRNRSSAKADMQYQDSLSLVTNYTFDYFALDDDTYTGRIRDGVTTYVDQAAATYTGDYGSLFASRNYLAWGTAPDSNLLVSAERFALESIGFTFGYRWLHVAWFYSPLDEYGGSRRYIAGTRIELSLLKGSLRVAANQIYLWAGDDRALELWYWNPLSFKYLVIINDKMEANAFYSLDASYVTPWKNRLYFEWLIDDLSLEGPAPHRLGIMVGIENTWIPFVPGLTVDVRYTNIMLNTYVTRDLEETYISHGKSLGHPLGNDFDTWSVRLTRFHTPWLGNEVNLSLTRHGEGGIDVPYIITWSGYDGPGQQRNPFPFGVVETRMSAEIDTIVHINKNLRFVLDGRYSRIENKDNVAGSSSFEWSVGLNGVISVSGGFRF